MPPRTANLALVKCIRTEWLYMEIFQRSPKANKSRFFWLKSPDIVEFSLWKRFILMWCGQFCDLFRKESACFDFLIIKWIQFVLQNWKTAFRSRYASFFYKKKTASQYCLPQMWCIKSVNCWLTRHQICCWQDFVK